MVQAGGGVMPNPVATPQGPPEFGGDASDTEAPGSMTGQTPTDQQPTLTPAESAMGG